MSNPEAPALLALPDGVIDLTAAQVRRGKQVAELLPIEVALLTYLAQHAPAVVSVARLHADVWGYSPRARTRAAYFAIRRLRQRLETDPGKPQVLTGTEGRGFTLAAPPVRVAPGVRAADLTRVLKLLEAPAALVVITGPAGVGKSTLLHDLARHLDGTLVDLEEHAPDWSSLPDQGVLLLDHLPKADIEPRLKTLRRDHPKLRILLTTRIPPGLRASQEHGLSPLPAPQAATLLTALLAARGVD
ncbi:MAG: hypothetical protein GXP62_15255, partial [Oligoflexia bacterium]|nr:hypothetical protein [Oligoflexia bacterium]